MRYGPTAGPTASGASFTARRDGRLFSLDAKTGKLTRVRQRWHPRSPRPSSTRKSPAARMDRLLPRSSGRTRSSSEFPATRGLASPRRGYPGVRRSHRQGGLAVPDGARPGEFGDKTWEGDSWKDRGGANAWGGFSVDAERGLVFAGLGSAAFDFYGGDRHGDNLFANCTIALDATTGKRVWHFQTLRHDLWDHDLPVYPNLVTVTHAGKKIDAVRRSPRRATSSCSTARRESRSSISRNSPCRAPTSPVSRRRRRSRSRSSRRRSPSQFLDETNITDIGPANRASVLDRRERSGAGRPSTPQPARDGCRPRLSRRCELVGCLVRSDDGLLYVNSNNVANIITLVESRRRRDAIRALRAKGYEKFLDHEGYSAMKPPGGS